jgi:hypothetical protein
MTACSVASTDTTLNVLTGCLVFVGLIQAGIFIWTGYFIKNQVESQRKAERAWLIVSAGNSGPTFHIPDGKQLYESEFSIAVKNVGRTPAHSIKVSTRFLKVSTLSDLPTTPDYSGTEPLHLAILTPGDEIGVYDKLPPEMNGNDVQAIYQGKLFVYFHACVEYLDIFDAKHTSRTGFVFPFVRPGVDNYRGAAVQRWGPSGYIEST